MKKLNMKELTNGLNCFEPTSNGTQLRTIPNNHFLTFNFAPLPKKPSLIKRVKLSLSEIYSKFKKSFIGKIKDLFSKINEERKKRKEQKLLITNFSKTFNVNHNRIKSIIDKIPEIETNNGDSINSAKKYNEVKRFKPPNFVDFDIIDMHNEYRNLKSKTIEELKDIDYDDSNYQLKKEERMVNESFYVNETLGQKIRRLNTR